jgi:hypothetical protein
MSTGFDSFRTSVTLRNWRRRLIIWGVVLVVGLIAVLATWNMFFVYVPPGQHLIIIAKDGDPLAPGQVLAEAGQKGIQREVKGEGWHFVMPVVYASEIEANLDVPAGSVGIVTARGGKPLTNGRLLAEEGEQGIQRRVLTPGSYRINRRGFDVALVPATEIKPGFVGVVRRLLGKDGASRFAQAAEEKGILRDVLQPGLYYINTKEFQVTQTEVGIFQTTFRYDDKPQLNTAITFISKGGFEISLDCTIEWEIRPNDMPLLVAEYGTRQQVENTVIDVQAHAIGRDKGIDYGVQDFLEGTKREKFQEDFTKELTRVCKGKNVVVHSAFIRNIVIPEAYLEPIRAKQIAAETEITNKAKEATAESEAQVERESQMIAQKSTEVEAETKRLVAGIDRQVENVSTNTQAELKKLKAQYAAQIATLESEKIRVLGEAESKVKTMTETAKSDLYRLKMQVFDNNGSAFLRYTMSQQLSPNLTMRLFHSGPGTFWTNMEGKNMSFLMPTANTPTANTPVPQPAPTIQAQPAPAGNVQPVKAQP